VFGGNHLGVLGSCQALLAEFFPQISLILSFFYPGVSIKAFFENKPEAAGGLASCSPWGHKRWDRTEQLN